jgi:sugar lactone lactonase YvrE
MTSLSPSQAPDASSPLRCVVACADRLGEGPVWVAAEARLYWFDIKACKLSWYEPEGGAHGAFTLPVRASAAAPRTSGGLLLATEHGLALFDTRTGSFAMQTPLSLPEGFRTNDGKMDTAGAFWWSTMDDNHGERPGSLFRTTPDGETRRMLDGIHIANTVSVSADGATFYLADSRLQTLFAHPIDDLSQRREFAHTRGQACAPDGSAVDRDGYLWNAQWGGWRIVRYSPDGEVDRIVPMPVAQPTSLAFGGRDLETLYVTSAWDDLPDEARTKQPLAGSLFAFEPGTPGLALSTFAG